MSNTNDKPAAFAFVPRSLVAKQHTPKVQQAKSSSLSSIKPPHLHDNNDDDVVKATSAQQRWPNGDEPVCVMCGKYGEYICDETDEDVCSLACKATHLKQVGLQAKPQFDETIEKQTTEEKVLFFEEHFQNTLQNVRQRMRHINQQKCEFFRQKFEIKTKGVNVPLLSLGFEECGFSQQLMENLKANDYLYPTSVQMQSIPIALNYRDMLVSATTSSGKTACFLLPMVQIIQHFLASLPTIHPFRRDPLALILAPTRELCMQIEEQIKALCQGIENIKTCLLVGGNPLPQQLYRLRHQIHFVIGTPGRINDVIDNHDGSLRLRHIKMVVLDEVDVMLQMGFLNQIERILSDIPPSPQYMMFSATIPRSIERLAEQKMKNPIFVSVGQSGITNSLVHQVILWVEDTSKRKKLFSVIREPKHFHPPMLVFVESRLGADMLSEAIQEKIGITCDSLHSDKTQTERNVILQNFLTGGYKVLVTTNVLGRGLDLHNVKQVIVFDMPKTIEDYIHQVGRAGRLHIQGVVMTFINKSNKNLFRPLQELCEKTGTKIPEELLTSPLLQSAREKEKKLKNEQAKEAKKRKWDEEDLNKKSLLDILTRKVR